MSQVFIKVADVRVTESGPPGCLHVVRGFVQKSLSACTAQSFYGYVWHTYYVPSMVLHAKSTAINIEKNLHPPVPGEDWQAFNATKITKH